MKCISLWQPWATLWASGAKQIETRDWVLKHRGPLAVHAAKVFKSDERDLCFCEPFHEHLAKVLDSIDAMPLGAIVGIVQITDCKTSEHLDRVISSQERAFGNYSPNRYGWVASQFRLFADPIPYKGQQGLFDVPDELLRGRAMR